MLLLAVIFLSSGIALAEEDIPVGDTVEGGEILAPSEIEQWVGEHVIPTVTAALAAAGGTIAAIIAFVKVIQKLLQGIRSTLEALGIKKESLDETDKRLVTLIGRLEAAEERNAKLEAEIASLKEMVKIGFCNNEYLVKNGYARQIARVYNHEEETV
jgi:hypothetical protein